MYSRILVTGARGYIGSALAARFPAVYRFEGDASTRGAWGRNLERVQPDLVIHLAAKTSYSECERNRYEAEQSNVISAKIGSKETRGWCKFIMASPVTVVGETDEHDYVDESHPCRPVDVYDVTKRRGEKAALENGAIVVRFSNVYGYSPSSSKPDRSLVNVFCKNAVNGIPNTVYTATRGCLRDYIHVDDAIDGMFVAAMWGASGIYNACSGTSVSIETMASLVGEYDLVDVVAYSIDMRSFRGVNRKLRGLGWNPEVPLSAGIQVTKEIYSCES